MAYEKQTWKNDSAPYIDAAHLNHMEDGIDGALPKSGGTMTGSLILKGSPTEDLETATKEYVDNKIVFIRDSTSFPSSYTGGSYYAGKIPIDDFSFDKYVIFMLYEINNDEEADYKYFAYLPVQPGKQYYVGGSYTHRYTRIDPDGKVYHKLTGDLDGNLSCGVQMIIFPVSSQINKLRR